jgi:hypothetical protein
VATWGELAAARPDLADAGRSMLYQFGVGLAFLGTVRPDGGPRVHPICPILLDEGLYGFIVPSPKRTDLIRDGRYWLHSFPAEENEDAFAVTGTATRRTDAIRSVLVERFLFERRAQSFTASDLDDQIAFEFDIQTCLLTRTTGHGDPEPRHTVWRS